MDDSDVINFLLSTEIIPLCLRIMENGSELSKTVRRTSFYYGTCFTFGLFFKLVGVLMSQVATFIVQKILLDDLGLNYICATAERFYAVRFISSFPWWVCYLLHLACICAASAQVSTVLSNMVAVLADAPSARLLKHVVRCYLRLSDNLRCAARRCMSPCCVSLRCDVVRPGAVRCSAAMQRGRVC
jgi:CCR4-NOT transcription complex subunit 9